MGVREHEQSLQGGLGAQRPPDLTGLDQLRGHTEGKVLEAVPPAAWFRASSDVCIPHPTPSECLRNHFSSDKTSQREIPLVQGLGLHASKAKGTASVPGQGTKIPQAVRCSAAKKKTTQRWPHNQGLNPIRQGSPTPGPQTRTSLQPVRNRAAQQEVSSGRAGEASFAAPHQSLSLPVAPHHLHYCLNHPPNRGPWKNCLPRNRSLVPKRLGTAATRM